MAFIPGNTGTSAKAVDGLEGPTAGSPVTFPSGFSGNFVPTALADANATLTSATSVVVMTPTANRVLTLPSSVPSAAFAITVINRSASFTIALNASGGGTVATVGLGQVTVLSTQTNPTTTAHWTISTNGAALQGGNSFGATMLIGTNDNFGIDFETNGTVKASISAAGNLGVGATNPLTKLHVNTAGNTSAGGISLQNAAAQQHFWYLSSNTNSRFEIGSAAGSWDWVNSNGTMLTISAAGAVTVGPSGSTNAGLVHTFRLSSANSYSAPTGTDPLLVVSSSSASGATTLVGYNNSATSQPGLTALALAKDNNTNGDFFFDARLNTNAAFTTTANKAFVFASFGTELASATRAGAWSFPVSLTAGRFGGVSASFSTTPVVLCPAYDIQAQSYLVVVSGNTSSGQNTVAAVFLLRTFYDNTNTWASGAGTVSQLANIGVSTTFTFALSGSNITIVSNLAGNFRATLYKGGPF